MDQPKLRAILISLIACALRCLVLRAVHRKSANEKPIELSDFYSRWSLRVSCLAIDERASSWLPCSGDTSPHFFNVPAAPSCLCANGESTGNAKSRSKTNLLWQNLMPLSSTAPNKSKATEGSNLGNLAADYDGCQEEYATDSPAIPASPLASLFSYKMPQ